MRPFFEESKLEHKLTKEATRLIRFAHERDVLQVVIGSNTEMAEQWRGSAPDDHPDRLVTDGSWIHGLHGGRMDKKTGELQVEVVYLNENLSGLYRTRILAHELGHAIGTPTWWPDDNKKPHRANEGAAWRNAAMLFRLCNQISHANYAERRADEYSI